MRGAVGVDSEVATGNASGVELSSKALSKALGVTASLVASFSTSPAIGESGAVELEEVEAKEEEVSNRDEAAGILQEHGASRRYAAVVLSDLNMLPKQRKSNRNRFASFLSLVRRSRFESIRSP